jgi:hypothetical protein
MANKIHKKIIEIFFVTVEVNVTYRAPTKATIMAAMAVHYRNVLCKT